MPARNLFGLLAQEHTNQYGDAHLVSGSKIKWRREMNDPIATWWDKSENGITIPDPISGTLTIAMGVTPNAESWIVSKESFTLPLKIAAGIQLSQKIANNEIYVELVGYDKVTGALDETRIAAWRVSGTDSTTNTIGRSEVRNGAAARLQSGNLTTVAQTGAMCILEITAESDEVWFSSKPADSLSSRSVAAVRNSISPDPAKDYKLRIRVKNGATAPASSTNVTVNFALAVDYTEQQIEVTGGNGNTQAAQSIPVAVVNGGGVSSPAIAASSTVTGLSVSKILSAASTNPTLVKSTAGRLYGYQLANFTAAWRFFRLYNLTVAPTVGTSAPFLVVAIPPNGMVDLNLTVPITFGTGISYSITGAVADLDATAVAASDVQGTLMWL